MRCGIAKREEAATHNGRRYVDWPLRRDQVHGPSLRGKRDGQLPGPAEKTAMLPKPRLAAKAERSNRDAVAKARGLPLHSRKPRA